MSSHEIARWLIRAAAVSGDGQDQPAGLLDGLCQRLVAAGVPVRRCLLALRTLHPAVIGIGLTWRAGQDMHIAHHPPDELQSERYRNSPLAAVADSGRPLRRRLAGEEAVLDFPVLEELAAAGLTDYLAVPLPEPATRGTAITFATDAPGGLEGIELLLDGILPELAVVVELHERRRLATTLLDTYVGFDAGARILAGKIHRGDSELVTAALWYSDLRNFTRIASSSAPEALLALLNEYFECMAGPVAEHGGQVLKFMGDGMLAIFRIGEGFSTRDACSRALRAARASELSLAALNQRRGPQPEPLQAGIALHVGEVLYGNIGTRERLDFTVIGAEVNLVARMESLCRDLERSPLVSAAFARAVDEPLESLGHFPMRGVAEQSEVFTPAAAVPPSSAARSGRGRP